MVATTGTTTRPGAVDARLEGAWDELAATTGAPPHLRPGWFRAWGAAFSPHHPVRALTAWRGPRLVGVLPIVPRTRGLRAPVNAETPAFGPVALDEAAARTLGAGLPPWSHAVDLPLLAADGHGRGLLDGVRGSGAASQCHVQRRSPYVATDGDWEAYQRGVLSSSRRRALRSGERRLRELGHLDLQTRDGTTGLDGLLEEGFGLEAAGWKGAAGTAVLSRPSTTSFYRALAAWASAHDLLRLHVLRLDGRAVAFSFNLVQHGVSYGLKTCYDEDLRTFGPGVLLVHRLLADAFATPGTSAFEFLGEADPFKLQFATGTREQVRLRAWRGATGTAQRLADLGADRARRAVVSRLPEELRRDVARRLSGTRAAASRALQRPRR